MREPSVRGEDLAVGDRIDESAGLVARVQRELPRRWVSDPNGGGDSRR